MYLLLKSSKINVKNHPVTKRLYQYRKILSQMDEVFEEIIKPQTEILMKVILFKSISRFNLILFLKGI